MNIMYEVARQQMAEQRRAAREAGEAQRLRAAAREARKAQRPARGRHSRPGTPEEAVLPAIPDFPHELLSSATGDTAPAPRPVPVRGRHARTGR
jgi:hypothetical protein